MKEDVKEKILLRSLGGDLAVATCIQPGLVLRGGLVLPLWFAAYGSGIDRAFVDGSNVDDSLNRKREAGGEALLSVFGVGGEAEFLQVEVLAVEIFLGVTVAEEIRGLAQRSRKSTYLSNQFTYTYNHGIYELVAVFSQPAGTEFQGSRQFELPSP